MLTFGIKTKLITPGDDLVTLAIQGAQESGNPIRKKDVVIFSAKVVGVSQGRLVDISRITPSEYAVELSRLYKLDPKFAEQIAREADSILGGVDGAVLTLKSGMLVPNAGADQSNAPIGYVALWPKDPQASAEEIQESFTKHGLDVGVLIIDSWILPLRAGSSAVTLGVAGFKPVLDLRGSTDLFGRTMQLKRINVADSLAVSANLVMGETTESTPIAVIRDAPVSFEGSHTVHELFMPADMCLMMHVLSQRAR